MTTLPTGARVYGRFSPNGTLFCTRSGVPRVFSTASRASTIFRYDIPTGARGIKRDDPDDANTIGKGLMSEGKVHYKVCLTYCLTYPLFDVLRTRSTRCDWERYYYAIATCVILLYDYILTLGDEINLAWSGKKSWAFWLFIANRYFPVTYQLWQITVGWFPGFGQTLCQRLPWYGIIMFVICTLLAQVVLTLRLYAVSKKNIVITTGFALVTTTQLTLGICLLAVVAKGGAQVPPPIPFQAFRMCGFVRHRNLEVAYTAISLFYDSLAFAFIIYFARTSRSAGLRVPTLLGTIAEDAMRYFLVIFSSHLVLAMTLLFARDFLQLLPASGNVVYLPVMISRIMLSLKRAANSPQKVWTLVAPPEYADSKGMKKFHPWKDTSGRGDDIPLDTYTE